MLIYNNLNNFFNHEPFLKITENDSYFNEYLTTRFIYRKELDQILNIISSNDQYRILILGAIGTGKTTLLHMISKSLDDKIPNKILYAYDLFNYDFRSIDEPEMPIFIDGIDTTNSHELLEYLQEKRFNRLICTSRIGAHYNNTSHLNLQKNKFFTHIITLNYLTNNQIFDLVYRLRLDDILKNSLISNIQALSKNGNTITPKEILQNLIEIANNDNLEKFYRNQNTLLYQYGKGIEYNTNPILYKNELISPSSEIIKGVTIVNDTLLKQVKKDPKIMRYFSPREFEQMVCELLDKEGYNVKLTKQTRDGGKDIIVVEKSILGEFCIYVECKKYDKARPVNVGLVRELYGTIMADNATAGMIMTTSYFSNDAKEFIKNIKYRMALKDYNDLIQEINKIDII